MLHDYVGVGDKATCDFKVDDLTKILSLKLQSLTSNEEGHSITW